MRYPGRGRKQIFFPSVQSFKNLIEKWDTPEGDGNGFWLTEERSGLKDWEMRYPGRGRKLYFSVLHSTTLFDWEMRYPGRGRKHCFYFLCRKAWKQLRNEIPRKGTETCAVGSLACANRIEKWDTPEGDGNIVFISCTIHFAFIEKWDTPEGDGNHVSDRRYVFRLKIEKWDTPEGDGNRSIEDGSARDYWEMRYPGRGRKLVSTIILYNQKIKLRNEIPRKGTETDTSVSNSTRT